ncbi:MAG: MipA/OmpV family protein [Deltaproteobacteria bacterium]|nr:MipA/OmpV family protein [Deltaproteobacteria bacterium]MBW2194103.1 MipA/OmpV family protein [Deltaproteobacteria bacterium]
MQRVSIRHQFAVGSLIISFFLLVSDGFSETTDLGGDSQPNSSQMLLAGVMPDHEGIHVDLDTEAKKDLSFTGGLGIAAVPDYEGSEDYKAVPLLFARADCRSGRYIEFLGNRLKMNVLANDTWHLGPLVRYRGKRDDDVDNDKVAKMLEVDESVEVGAFLTYKISNCHIGIQGAWDVSDGHDGFVARLETGYNVPLKNALKFGITLFTTYANDDYMDSYFSVTTANRGTSGLALYDADGGIKDFGATLTLGYAPWNNWGITGILGYTLLLGDAEDSPLVDAEGSNGQFLGGVMATYRF